MERIPEQLAIQRASSPTTTAIPTSATRERFPSFDDPNPNLTLLPVTESPQDISPGQPVPPPPRWPVRRQSQGDWQPWRPGGHGHRTRRSVSEAISRIRTRTGSVSENAQELAEALKAPISWKLIVNTEFHSCSRCRCNTY